MLMRILAIFKAFGFKPTKGLIPRFPAQNVEAENSQYQGKGGKAKMDQTRAIPLNVIEAA